MYLPNAHTDFIFSIVGEELGLIGACAVLVAFTILAWVGIKIAMRAPDTFGRLLGTGIVAWLGLQALVNLGAVTGVLPITGVPLPFLSAGGSSLVVSLVGIGILVNIARSGPKTGSRVRAVGGVGATRSGSGGRPKSAKSKGRGRPKSGSGSKAAKGRRSARPRSSVK
jgi:cell division protein FtsW